MDDFVKFGLVTIALVSLALGLAVISQSPQLHTKEIEEKPTYKAILTIYKNGELVDVVENLLTDIGKEWIEDQMVTPQTANFTKFISVSNSTTDCVVTDTILPGEIDYGGLARAECTITDLGIGNWSCEYTFTATTSIPNVRQAGYNWNATSTSDGNLLACANFTSVNMQANDQILIRWNVTIT